MADSDAAAGPDGGPTAVPDVVALIGLGAMGAPMARHLAGGPWRLLVHDADVARTGEVAAAAGAEAATLQDVAAADVAVLSLPDSTVVEAVLSPPGGLLAALRPGSLVIDVGSSRPASTQALAAVAAARGIDLVDAPVSGGVAKAATAELSVMVGGDAAAVERALPVLARLGVGPVHVGPVGAGHAMKALNNLLSAIGLVGASEVLSVGSRFGLDPSTMLEVLNASTGRNHATEVKVAQHVLSRTFASGFGLRLMVKDLTTALDLAHSSTTPAPLSAACLELCVAALRELGDGADHTEVARSVERRAGVELHPTAPAPAGRQEA